MDELLDALGVRGRARRAAALAIWAGFAVAMVGIAAGQALLESRLGFGVLGCAAVLVGMWVLWTVWHSVLFGWDRRRLLRRGPAAYRVAFARHIFPGITIGFSQMLRPAWNGVDLRDGTVFPAWPATPAALAGAVLGCAVLAAALALFGAAWHTLGAARVGFVGEFVAPEAFAPVRRGPYAMVRHPLFWAGVLSSVAIALLCQRPVDFVLAGINAGYGLVYNSLEDRRLVRIFGRAYGDYASTVPHILPSAHRRRATS